jgi:hypothetical protein
MLKDVKLQVVCEGPQAIRTDRPLSVFIDQEHTPPSYPLPRFRRMLFRAASGFRKCRVVASWLEAARWSMKWLDDCHSVLFS